MSRSQKDNIFNQATFKRAVWRKAMSVIAKYEMGMLKDQKLMKKGGNLGPEFKQHLLAPIHNLDPRFQEEVLTKVSSLGMSLKEFKTEAEEFRAM